MPTIRYFHAEFKHDSTSFTCVVSILILGYSIIGKKANISLIGIRNFKQRPHIEIYFENYQWQMAIVLADFLGIADLHC